MSEEKISNLETIIAHHEQQIADLSEVAARQWDEIDALTQLVLKMRDKMQSSSDTGGEQGVGVQSSTEFAAQNRPPHY